MVFSSRLLELLTTFLFFHQSLFSSFLLQKSPPNASIQFFFLKTHTKTKSSKTNKSGAPTLAPPPPKPARRPRPALHVSSFFRWRSIRLAQRARPRPRAQPFIHARHVEAVAAARQFSQGVAREECVEADRAPRVRRPRARRRGGRGERRWFGCVCCFPSKHDHGQSSQLGGGERGRAATACQRHIPSASSAATRSHHALGHGVQDGDDGGNGQDAGQGGDQEGSEEGASGRRDRGNAVRRSCSH